MTTTTSPKRTPKPVLPELTEGQVRHVYRTAIKVGEDFHTLECEITVPLGASDALIHAAQDTAERVRAVQIAATHAAIADMREDAMITPTRRASRYTLKDPDAPASDKQRNAIDRIAKTKGWSLAHLVTFCEGVGYPVLTLTKGQASWLIDMLTTAPTLPFTPQAAQDAAGTPQEGSAPPVAGDNQDIPF